MEHELWLPEQYHEPVALPLVTDVPFTSLQWLSDPERADGDEVFVRLSAFIDDIRIDRERLCCAPFTFTTTYAEAMTCRNRKTTVNVCDRYALPSDQPPKWMFVIKPKRGDVLRRGKVKPAFMKSGGGTEVFFQNGTSDYTVVDLMRW